MGQTLHDGGLTGSRLTNQDRVVLCTTAQYLKHTADFLVTTDDRVQLAAPGCVYQVDGVFRQALVGVLAALALHFLAVTQLEDGLLQCLLAHAHAFHHLRHARVDQE